MISLFFKHSFPLLYYPKPLIYLFLVVVICDVITYNQLNFVLHFQTQHTSAKLLHDINITYRTTTILYNVTICCTLYLKTKPYLHILTKIHRVKLYISLATDDTLNHPHVVVLLNIKLSISFLYRHVCKNHSFFFFEKCKFLFSPV